MKSAPPTIDEKKRLQALYDYDVLDTEAEKVFDDLTQLASEICDTPIALISLVDPARQWFKSKVGISACETSRDIAFCAHAIHHRDVFEVEDTLKDARFYDNPLVTGDPNIRFYAGAQLVTPAGYAIGTLCTISDQPKKLTERQRNALQILSREVISQMELRRKVKEVEKANRHKTEYLSNISHELRTPLNAIIGFTQVMLENLPPEIDQKFAGYLSSIDLSGRRLLELINSVLDLSKIEEGKMELHLTQVNLESFIHSIKQIMDVKAEEKLLTIDVSIAVAVPEFIYADEAKLSQIMINLLGNAIKFSKPGQTIRIDINAIEKALIFAVKDQGIGISNKDQDLLFNKFEQVGKNVSNEGTGLGLAITKGLVDLMNGEIRISSQIGKGTLVKLTLPALPAPGNMNVQAFANDNSLHRTDHRILVVEDNEINQQVAQAMFHNIGLDIDIASTGEEALKIGRSNQYDVVFMDLHLPGMDGFETARKFKSLQSEVHIIALTADAFVNEERQKQNPAIELYLTKPISKTKLIQTLNTVDK